MRIKSPAYLVEVTQSQPESAQAAAREKGSARAAVAGRASRAGFDRVEISSTGVRLEKLKRELAALPEVRLDRVALARQSLQGSGYLVEPAVLAQKMVELFAMQQGEVL